MKIIIDENLCIGCGTCETLCSKCFKIVDGIAQATCQECDCNVQEVADSCPAHAINIEQ